MSGRPRAFPYRSSVILAFLVLLSALMTYPLLLNMAGAVPGDLGDPLFNIWVIGWSLHKLVSFDLGGLWQANIFYPSPLSLAYSEHLFASALFGLPVYLLSGNLILTYNFLFLASFILSGWGMYLLVRDLTGREAPSLIAAFIFAFAPFRFGHLGHLQVLTLQWVPFAFLYLHRFFSRPSDPPLLLFGLFYLLTVLSSGYYALFLTLFVGLFMLYHFVAPRQLPSRELWGKLAILTFGVIVLAAPVFYPYLQVKELLGFSRSIDEVISFSADLTSYLSAPPDNRLWGQVTQRFHRPEGQLHPGLVTSLLALLGAVLSLTDRQAAGSQKRLTRFTLVMAISAFVLSFGPVIHLHGNRLFPGPYLLLYQYVPGFDGLRVPARLAPFFVFAAAILAGQGLLIVTGRLKALTIKRLFALGVGALILIESLSIPLPMPEVPGKGTAPSAYHWLSRQPGHQPVVELPLQWPMDMEYVYFSTFHWKDLLNGYSGYAPPSYLMAQTLLGSFPSSAALGFLEELGVRYVIIHLNKLSATARETLLAALPRYHSRLRKVRDFGPDQIYAVVHARGLTREAAARRWSSMPKVFPAQVLPSRVGRLVEDPLAEGELVRRVEAGEAGVVTFGPYLPLSPGHYQARFFLRVFPTQDRTERQVGHLDVATEEGIRVAFRDLDSTALLGYPGFRMVPLDFEVRPADNRKKIECRVVSTGKAGIAVQRIEIWPTAAPGAVGQP
ncbi:MAG: hypothetical protein HYY85_22040 [Deltaproteobacteria bacterium]|nr:hypothetical protein [Deltaproteobacteria bacterium]